MSAAALTRLAAAALVAAAVGLAAPASPAGAVECGTTTGVTVVVDFTDLGGAVATTCVEDGGGDTAAELFEVDHDLTRVQSFPGAVCRVDGAPSDLSCRAMPPEHYYWGLYWSPDGGDRTYSSEGVDSLEVPDGGSVAFVFHESEPASSPSPSPTTGGSAGGSGGSGGSGTGGTTPSPSAAPSSSAPVAGSPAGGRPETGSSPSSRDRRDTERRDRERDDRPGKKDRGPSDAPTDPLVTSDDPADAVPTADGPQTDGGVPVWVAPVGIGGLFAAAGAVAWWRRRIVA